jgi:RNA polymerase sigma-70 factor, ECF subfamily
MALLTDDAGLVAALADGDENAFRTLVETYSPALLRVAMTYVPSRAVAEEIVQETWLGVMRGAARFEGRSSVKTWLFRILVNIAITRGQRERRSTPFSALAPAGAEGDHGPAVDPDRFLPADHARWPGHWAIGPTAWPTPEEGVLSREARDLLLAEIDRLPPNQRNVIVLRDVEGWPSAEVCDALGLSEGNQRVLLHRARSRVRNALEEYFGAVEPTV